MSTGERHPLHPLVILAGIIVAVVGTVIAAMIIGEGRFAPSTPTFGATSSLVSIATNTPIPTNARTPIPAVICWERCWQYDENAHTMTWIGAVDGWVDIHQDGDDVALSRLRMGWTAIFTPNVPGEIGACVVIFNGNGRNVLPKCTSSDNSDLYSVPSGQTLNIQSPGSNGGFRWRPACGYGYRANCP